MVLHQAGRRWAAHLNQATCSGSVGTMLKVAALVTSCSLGCGGDPGTSPASLSSSVSSAKPGVSVTSARLPHSAKPGVSVTDARLPPSTQPTVDRAYTEMTQGAVDSKHLVVFVRSELGGIKRSNLLEQVFMVAGAYALAEGGYANVDVQNTFLRGKPTSTLEKDRMERCKQKEKVGGATACIDVRSDRTTIHWFLPDRLTVTLSAPTEATARAMAKDLDIAGLQKLSAAATP